MDFIKKFIFFIPGAAIGFILSSGISQANQSLGMFVLFLGATIGGSITTTIGNLLFLKSEYDAQKSGGLIKVIIRILILAIVIVAIIIVLGKFEIIN